MADTLVQVVLQGGSNLPEDRYVNTLAFQGDDWDGSQTDELFAAYETFLGNWAGNLSIGPHLVKCYHLGSQPQGPYFQKQYNRAAAVGGGAPTEVALCLSFATVDDPEQSLPRRRGRIYLGPLSGSAATTIRPGSSLIDGALDLGESIAQVGFAQGVTWAVHSRLDGTLNKIESIWVDDSWDTQRRRGLAPTMKEVRDVQ